MRSSFTARLSTQKSTSRAHNRSQVVRVATYNSAQSPTRLLPAGPLNDGPSKRVLPLLSELVEIQALTTAFEQVAGRSAMIGFFLAISAETFQLPQNATSGIFGGVCLDSVSDFAYLVAGLVACSAVLAYSSPMKLGRTLLEPILASLTSESRSAGALTDRNVDNALDATFASVFNPKFFSKVFPQIDSLILFNDTDEEDDEDIIFY